MANTEKINEDGIASGSVNVSGSGAGVSGTGDNTDPSKPLAQPLFKKKKLRDLVKRK